MINIAVLGYGTVGSGVIEVLETNQEIINRNSGEEIKVKYILDLKDFKGTFIEKLITHDFNDILEDDEVSMVVEVMGGIEPAYSFVKQSLLKGKSAVTSNKELVAKHGPELLKIAKQNNVNFFFEASVGGGIPIIRPLNQCLVADDIFEITGILNGTTNFILSKMKAEGRTFEDVLKEAQDLGFAERNPAADVEGYDACRKIAILSSLAYGQHVDYEDIYTEGITRITKEDIEYAEKLGLNIKLLGTSKRSDKGAFAFVAPVMLGSNHPLSNVNDVFNGIFVKGNVLGDVMFYGSGAGKLPTASAVMSDIVAAAKLKNQHIDHKWNGKKLELMKLDDIPVAYYFRVELEEEKKAVLESLFAIDTFVESDQPGEVVFITKMRTEGEFSNSIQKLEEENIRIISKIRVEK